VVLGLRAREALRSSREASRRVGLDGGGPEWPVHGGQSTGGRWHAVRRGNSAILCSGGAESERGSTVKASVCFIGASTGMDAGSGVARCGRAGPSAGACSGVTGQVEHVCVFFCPSSNAC
jgi:hypothetical protein